MKSSYVPYDLYPAFGAVQRRCSISGALRLRAIFFERCVIAADIIAADPNLLSGIESNAELCRLGHIEIATYDNVTELADLADRHNNPHIYERICRIDGIIINKCIYNAQSISNLFRDSIASYLEKTLRLVRDPELARDIDAVVSLIRKGGGLLTLDDVLRIDIAPSINAQLQRAARRTYAKIGSSSVSSAPVLPTSLYTQEITGLSPAPTALNLLEILHANLLTLFALRRDILEDIPDTLFATFTRSNEVRAAASKLMRIADDAEKELESGRTTIDLEDEVSQARRELLNLLRKEILLERHKKEVAEWVDAAAMEALGTVIPMAGVLRKTGEALAKASSKHFPLPISKPSLRPLHEYIGGLQDMSILTSR